MLDVEFFVVGLDDESKRPHHMGVDVQVHTAELLQDRDAPKVRLSRADP
jgi:hypothetical protein